MPSKDLASTAVSPLTNVSSNFCCTALALSAITAASRSCTLLRVVRDVLVDVGVAAEDLQRRRDLGERRRALRPRIADVEECCIGVGQPQCNILRRRRHLDRRHANLHPDHDAVEDHRRRCGHRQLPAANPQSNVQDLQAAVRLRAKAVQQKFEDTFVNGDTIDAKPSSTASTSSRPAASPLTMGVNGATLALAKLDELVDAVKGGQPAVMSKRSRRT